MRSACILIGVIMVVAVCVGSLAPSIPPPPGTHGDKLEHFLAYACLTWWWGMLYPRTGQRWVVCLLFVAMGVALEYAQRATGYRVFDELDMAANGVGALLGRFLVETPFGKLLSNLDRGRA